MRPGRTAGLPVAGYLARTKGEALTPTDRVTGPGVVAMITLEELFASPQLPQWLQAIDERLRAERVRRARFQEELRPGQKAEFINGEVIFHSPARLRHVEVSRRLVLLLGSFVQARGLGLVGFEKLLVNLPRNDYEPDVLFYGREKAAAFGPEQRLFPAPDLAVEVLSPSTEARDRGVKFTDYALNGVGEYWIVDPDAPQVERYVLDPTAEAYRPAETVRPGQELRSTAVAGFAVPVQALFDDAANHEALRALLTG